MLLNALSQSADLAWTGEETIFAAGFQALSVAHVSAVFVAPSGAKTTLEDGVHLTLARDQTGFISAVPIALPAAPGAIRFRRETPTAQDVNFVNLGSYSAEVHERLADAAAMRAAELARDIAELTLSSVVPDADDVTFADPLFDAETAGNALRELRQAIDQPLAGAEIVAAIDAALGSGEWQVPGSGTGEANVGGNIGTGAGAVGLYDGKSGLTLRFRGLAALDGVNLTYNDASKTLFLTADTDFLDALYLQAAEVGPLAFLDAVGAAEISAGAVAFSKLAAAAFASQAEAEAGVAADRLMTPQRTQEAIAALAAAAGRYVGEVIETSAITLSPGCVWANGQLLSRATYPDLFAATVATASGITVTAASDLVNWTAHGRSRGDIVQFYTDGTMPGGMTSGEAYYVQASGLTANAFKIGDTPDGSVVNITSAGSGTLRVEHAPYGNGNGSTTFAVVNRMERAGIGRSGMGGVDGPDVVSATDTGNPGLNPRVLGKKGGKDRHALTVAQLAAHAHAYVKLTGTGKAPANSGGGSPEIYSTPGAYATTEVGSNQEHPQLSPSIVMNYMVFTGVL